MTGYRPSAAYSVMEVKGVHIDQSFLYRYCIIQLKRGMLYLPKMLASLVIMLVLIGGFLFVAGQWMLDFQQKQKVTLAISLPENAEAEKWMFSILKEMDSIKENCKLIQTDTQQALEMLADGRAYGAVIIPSGFVNGIMTGKNIPADIYLPSAPLQRDLISILTKAGAQSLASAQAGIYAMSDFAVQQHKRSALNQIADELNREYIRFTLKRPQYFRHINIDQSNALPLPKQYVASGITLFLLFCLMSMSQLLSTDSRAMTAKLSVKGVIPPVIVAVQTAVVWILMSMIGLGLLLLLIIVSSSKLQWDTQGVAGLFGFLSATFAIASFGVFVYTIAKSQWAAMLYIFLASVAMLLIAGGILPLYLLPGAVASMSVFMPVFSIMKSIENVFTGGFSYMASCLLWGMAFLIATMFVAKWQWGVGRQ